MDEDDYSLIMLIVKTSMTNCRNCRDVTIFFSNYVLAIFVCLPKNIIILRAFLWIILLFLFKEVLILKSKDNWFSFFV